MSNEPKPDEGLIRSLVDLGGRTLQTLPPAFIMLVGLNIAFLGLVMWFLDAQMDTRAKLLERIIDHCLVTR